MDFENNRYRQRWRDHLKVQTFIAGRLVASTKVVEPFYFIVPNRCTNVCTDRVDVIEKKNSVRITLQETSGRDVSEQEMAAMAATIKHL